MRSLAVFHVAEVGGPLRSLEAELRWLAELGRLELLVPQGGSVAEELAALAPVRRLDYSGLVLPAGPLGPARSALAQARAARSIRAAIRELRPDLVLVVSATLPAALLASRRERVPALVYAGELLARGQLAGGGRASGAAAVVAMTRRLASAIVACSGAVADQYRGGRAAVSVIYPPLRGRYAGGDRYELRARFGVPAGAPCVVALGNISERRGQDVLVRAVGELRRRRPDVRCLIAGEALPRERDRAFRDRLEALIGELGLAGAVTLIGFVEDVADLYAAADVVVNPTAYEAFGRVAFEAALAGRPVVSTRAGAIPEVLHDGESALLVEPGDHRALAAAIARLLDDGELVGRLVAGARGFALRHLDGEAALRAFATVVEGVRALPRRAAPRG